MSDQVKVNAPNGDVYEMDAVTASGLVGSAGAGWSYVDAPADSDGAAKAVSAMNKAELIAHAESLGLAVPSGANKAALVDLISGSAPADSDGAAEAEATDPKE